MNRNLIQKSVTAIFTVLFCLGIFIPAVSAADGDVKIQSKVYVSGDNENYSLSAASVNKNSPNPYGNLRLRGDVTKNTTKNGVPAYTVGDGGLSIRYMVSAVRQGGAKSMWHLTKDNSKKINTVTLDSKIMKGAVIVQTSKDKKNWITVDSKVDVFAKYPKENTYVYETKSIEQINGCYYRVIVAYEETRNPKDSLFSKNEYRKIAEVYEFFACSSEYKEQDTALQQNYAIGKAVRTEKFDGYVGETAITKKDPHYGITIGQFYVSGYTNIAKRDNKDTIFLKNVGDKVVLWFRLNENIDAVGGTEDIKVTRDHSGSDQYFQTPTTDFGRGTLIVRHKNYQNELGEPQIYTNYLEANASVGADTIVGLYEEGDYEVALDYELTRDKLIDEKGHYRIFFRFSIRNGNCMVFLFDTATGSELTNSSLTDNGFRLDLAKSRYLEIYVKREVLADSADGLVEDIRFNGVARDGAEYTTEGIYTITAINPYTKQETVKKIYVGKNPVLKAYMTTEYTIPEINKLVEKGATITKKGTILPVGTIYLYIGIGAIATFGIVAAGLIFRKKKKVITIDAEEEAEGDVNH